MPQLFTIKFSPKELNIEVSKVSVFQLLHLYFWNGVSNGILEWGYGHGRLYFGMSFLKQEDDLVLDLQCLAT